MFPCCEIQAHDMNSLNQGSTTVDHHTDSFKPAFYYVTSQELRPEGFHYHKSNYKEYSFLEKPTFTQLIHKLTPVSNQKVHYNPHRRPLTGPVLNHTNPIHNLTKCFVKTRFNTSLRPVTHIVCLRVFQTFFLHPTCLAQQILFHLITNNI